MLRFAVPRGDFAAPVERLAVERAAVVLRAAEDRLEPAAEDFARLVLFFPPAGLRAPLERLEVLRAVLLRVPDERLVRRPGEAAVEPELALAPLSVHLPDITRCAASATASAMIAPSLVALDMTLLAACEAVSAASSPASRILRRAAGLALIAAAAAASPAASISLLIAAFASLSTVLLPDLEDDDRLDDDLEDDLEELFLADFAIAFSPSVA